MYYIYRHIRLDKNEVFYIGKGTTHKRRIDRQNYYQRAYAKDRNNSIWKRIINKTGYKVEIIYETECEAEAFNKEIEFIKLYGRININTGTLANLTNGGEGETGRIVSEEVKEKYRKINKGRKHSDEVNKSKGRKGESNPFYGRVHKESTIRKFVVSQSTPIEVIYPDGSKHIFECVYDCSECFNVSISYIKRTIIRLKQGIPMKPNNIFYMHSLSRVYGA